MPSPQVSIEVSGQGDALPGVGSQATWMPEPPVPKPAVLAADPPFAALGSPVLPPVDPALCRVGGALAVALQARIVTQASTPAVLERASHAQTRWGFATGVGQ